MRWKGKLKLGWFPLPLAEAARIRKFLVFPATSFAGLDPCIGEGSAFWEWLCDALYAVLHRSRGLAAIATLSLAVLCFTSLLVYLTARVHTGRMVAFAVTCLVMATTTIHWLARPHLLTWLLVAFFCWVIERARVNSNGAPLLALPLLMVPWVNLHPGFLTGVLILTVRGAAEHVEGLLGLTQEGHVVHAQWSRWFSLTALACLAATLVNPYGIELHKHIVEYLFSASPRSSRSGREIT